MCSEFENTYALLSFIYRHYRGYDKVLKVSREFCSIRVKASLNKHHLTYFKKGKGTTNPITVWNTGCCYIFVSFSCTIYGKIFRKLGIVMTNFHTTDADGHMIKTFVRVQ